MLAAEISLFIGFLFGLYRLLWDWPRRIGGGIDDPGPVIIVIAWIFEIVVGALLIYRLWTYLK